LEDSWRAHNFLSFQYTRVIATDVMATLTPSTSAAPSRRLPRGRESRVRPNRERHFRVVTRAADPNASLPQALLEAVSKKFIDDVSGVASLFDDKPAKYPRPPTLPVAGNTLDFVRGGHETLLAWALEYGANPSGVHEVQMLGAGPILHVVDPQIARELMVAKADEFPDRGASAMARFFREDQAAFVNTTGEQWMAYRKIGIASVNGSALDRLAGKVAERSEALVAKWHKKSQNQKSGGRLEIDVDTEAQAVTLEVIHEALFSEMLCVIDEDPNAMRIARSFRQFNEANQDVMNDFLQLYQEFDTPDAIRRETHRARLRSHFDQRADARQALIEKTGNAKDAPQDLLTALLTARDPVTGVALTRDDINLTLTEMMVAGHDTTAATVACLLTLLAANPRALRRAKQEVHAVCLSLGGALPITVKEVSQLNYLDDCMKETMRLYPAVMIVLRKADDGVGGGVGGRARRDSKRRADVDLALRHGASATLVGRRCRGHETVPPGTVRRVSGPRNQGTRGVHALRRRPARVSRLEVRDAGRKGHRGGDSERFRLGANPGARGEHKPEKRAASHFIRRGAHELPGALKAHRDER